MAAQCLLHHLVVELLIFTYSTTHHRAPDFPLFHALHSIALYSIPSCIKPHGIFAMHGILICSFILFGSYFTIT